MRERDLDRLALAETRQLALGSDGRGKSERQSRERGESG
jgi:hypothetical protein